MSVTTVTVQLQSIAPYSQSRYHETPKKDKEAPGDYENRTWKERLHVNREGYVYIPAMAFKNNVQEAAQYLSEKVQGKGNNTYTKHFGSGVIVDEPLVLDLKPDDVVGEWLFLDAQGKPGVGSGKRVKRCYPLIPEWGGIVTYYVCDATITEEVFQRTLETAGQLIGIGRFRPRNRGYYGRFKVVELNWQE